jgi:outer membrane lipoprotein-sorting protein
VSAPRPRSSRLALLAVALLAGCAIAIPPPRQTISEEARRAVELLITRWQAVTDLRALADIVVERGGQRQQLSGVLLAKAPSSVRVEALSPFGQPFVLAVVHDGRLTAYNTVTREAVVGEANAETTAKLLSLPFEAEDMVAVVTGHAVPPRGLRVAELKPPDAMGPSISLIGDVHEKRVWMDFTTGIVRQVEIIGGRVAAIVTYQRNDVGAMTGFDATAVDRYVVATVRYRNAETGVGLTPDNFALTLPKDAKTQPIR